MSLTPEICERDARALPDMTPQQLADLALQSDRLARQFETSGNEFSTTARRVADAIANEAARRAIL